MNLLATVFLTHCRSRLAWIAFKERRETLQESKRLREFIRLARSEEGIPMKPRNPDTTTRLFSHLSNSSPTSLQSNLQLRHTVASCSPRTTGFDSSVDWLEIWKASATDTTLSRYLRIIGRSTLLSLKVDAPILSNGYYLLSFPMQDTCFSIDGLAKKTA